MPVEGMRRTIAMCLDLGYSAADVRAMTTDNPKALLGLHEADGSAMSGTGP